MEIVDLGVIGIGQNEVVKRQVKLGKKTGAHLEKNYISIRYELFVSLKGNNDKKTSHCNQVSVVVA